MRRGSKLRRIVWTGAALALLLGLGYAYATSGGVLRAKLTGLFQKLDLHVVRIGEVSFSPWSGLEVLDMRVEAAERSPLAFPARVSSPPALLRVPRAHVSVSPWALLLGKFRPDAVELEAPAIAVVWPEMDESIPWGASRRNYLALSRQTPADLPRLKISNADIEVFAVQDDRIRLMRRWVVDGRGELVEGDGGQPRAYVLRFEQVAGPVSAKHAGESSLVEVSWQADQLIAELGWVDLEFVQSLLPAAWTERIREMHLTGQARARRVIFERGGIASAEVCLDDLHCCVPIETDIHGAEGGHFAQVTSLTGVINYAANGRGEQDGASPAHGDLHMRFSARVNEAPATFSLALFNVGRDDQDHTVRGKAETFGISGLSTGGYEMSLQIEGLTLPTATENPGFVSSTRLPGAIRSAFRKYNPEGPVNLDLELWSEPGKSGRLSTPSGSADESRDGWANTRYRGRLEAAGSSFRYFEFPYLIEDVHGFVRFSNGGIVLDGLLGRHGPARIRADGRVTDSKSWTGFELEFRADNLPTDSDLYAALPNEYKQLWDSAAPIGLCDVLTTMRREHGSAETGSLDTEIRVNARLLSGSLALGETGRLENADGLIRIADRMVELDDLHGYLDGALVRIDGQVALAAEDSPSRHNLHIEVAQATLERTTEVRDRQGCSIGEIHFEGVGDIWGHIRSGDAGQDHYAVRITDGSLTGFEAGTPWTHASGWVSLSGDEQEIVSFAARREEGRLAISGTLPARLGLDTPITLDLRATDADLERLLRQLVPGRWSNIPDALGLAGGGELTARFHPQAVSEELSQQVADIRIEAERMRPAPLPLDLRDIKADLTLRSEGFDLHEAVARYGDEGRLVVSGHGGWAEGELWSDVRVEVRELEFTPELVQAMPGPLAALLKRLSPEGRLHLTLDQVRLTGSQEQAWNVIGEILLRDAELNVTVPLTEFDGRLWGSCRVHPNGQLTLDVDFLIDRGRLMSRPIERWEGRLLRHPGSSRVRLENIRGRLCGGEVVGFAVIDPDTSTYELSLTLHDVSLEQFLQRKKDDSDRESPGRLDGHVFVRGSTKDPAQRNGGGELRIRGTSLLSSPVTASVVEASQQRKRVISDKVEQAELRFVWQEQELKFTRVDIHSRDLRLVGMGRWNMRSDEISMTLLGATPEDAPRLFLLTDLLETAGQELMQYRVEGTRAKPRVTIEPLHNLTDPLRKLLKGEWRIPNGE